MGRYREFAIKMASFWVDAIAEGKRGSAGDVNLDIMMALIDPFMKPISEDTLIELQIELEHVFEGKLDKGNGTFHTRVDYAPDPILVSACEAVGIPPRLLPIKSSCWCRRGEVVVGVLGYSGEEKVL